MFLPLFLFFSLRCVLASHDGRKTSSNTSTRREREREGEKDRQKEKKKMYTGMVSKKEKLKDLKKEIRKKE